ncbi:hypothetical protein SLEP1_g53950 [Rubroshorea leprosula]|uniref:Uncharacterized protein n=1 Tax=Rubroshorea leprosula TaxID=152421 RepID=A0AAV5MAV3_9ROSI|nr:hypothetical protein SLEP1_g53950 [Rubroshorea leprosula]
MVIGNSAVHLVAAAACHSSSYAPTLSSTETEIVRSFNLLITLSSLAEISCLVVL